MEIKIKYKEKLEDIKEIQILERFIKKEYSNFKKDYATNLCKHFEKNKDKLDLGSPDNLLNYAFYRDNKGNMRICIVHFSMNHNPILYKRTSISISKLVSKNHKNKIFNLRKFLENNNEFLMDNYRYNKKRCNALKRTIDHFNGDFSIYEKLDRVMENNSQLKDCAFANRPITIHLNMSDKYSLHERFSLSREESMTNAYDILLMKLFIEYKIKY